MDQNDGIKTNRKQFDFQRFYAFVTTIYTNLTNVSTSAFANWTELDVLKTENAKYSCNFSWVSLKIEVVGNQLFHFAHH